MHDGRNRRSATTSIDEQGFRRRPLRRDSESVGLYYIPAFAETPLAGAHTIVEIRGGIPPLSICAQDTRATHTRPSARRHAAAGTDAIALGITHLRRPFSGASGRLIPGGCAGSENPTLFRKTLCLMLNSGRGETMRYL